MGLEENEYTKFRTNNTDRKKKFDFGITMNNSVLKNFEGGEREVKFDDGMIIIKIISRK